MQSYYKAQSSDNLIIQDRLVKQNNPTPPAYFVSFTDNHIYEFAYNSTTFQVLSPLQTNHSTCLGPLIFPIFPVGIINAIFAPEQRSNNMEIRVLAAKIEYTEKDLANISILNLDTGKIVSPDINYFASKNRPTSLFAILNYRFGNKMPTRFQLFLAPSHDGNIALTPSVIFHKVWRPSISAGVW